MSHENVEIVRRMYELWSGGDWEAMVELVDPDVEQHGTIGGLGEGQISRGADQIRQRFEAEDIEVWEEHRIEPVRFIDAGEQVVVVQHEYQRGKGSGVEIEIDTASVFDVRGGRIVRIQPYMNPAAALEAVGLSNMEVVRRAYEALSQAGLDGLLEHFHPDAEYDLTAATGPFAGMYYGRAAIRSFLADYFESWEYVRMEPEDFIEVGADHVVLPLHMQMRGKGSGVEVEARTFNVWTMRDGVGVRIAVYNDKAEALEAAGLSS